MCARAIIVGMDTSGMGARDGRPGGGGTGTDTSTGMSAASDFMAVVTARRHHDR